MAVQTEKTTGEIVTGAVPQATNRVLQAVVPLIMLLAAGAAGVGAVSLVGTGSRPAPVPTPHVTSAVSGPLQTVGPNAREGRLSPASSCPPLLDGHPSHRVRRTWVCPTP